MTVAHLNPVALRRLAIILRGDWHHLHCPEADQDPPAPVCALRCHLHRLDEAADALDGAALAIEAVGA